MFQVWYSVFEICFRGGILLTVTGRYLDSVATPKLQVTGSVSHSLSSNATETIHFESSVSDEAFHKKQFAHTVESTQLLKIFIVHDREIAPKHKHL